MTPSRTTPPADKVEDRSSRSRTGSATSRTGSATSRARCTWSASALKRSTAARHALEGLAAINVIVINEARWVTEWTPVRAAGWPSRWPSSASDVTARIQVAPTLDGLSLMASSGRHAARAPRSAGARPSARPASPRPPRRHRVRSRPGPSGSSPARRPRTARASSPARTVRADVGLRGKLLEADAYRRRRPHASTRSTPNSPSPPGRPPSRKASTPSPAWPDAENSSPSRLSLPSESSAPPRMTSSTRRRRSLVRPPHRLQRRHHPHQPHPARQRLTESRSAINPPTTSPTPPRRQASPPPRRPYVTSPAPIRHWPPRPASPTRLPSHRRQAIRTVRPTSPRDHEGLLRLYLPFNLWRL